MRRASAIPAPSIFTPACGGAGDSAADAGGRERGAEPAPGSVDVLGDMYGEDVGGAEPQVREAAP